MAGTGKPSKNRSEMGRVDKLFQDTLSSIMARPWEDVGRPKWADGKSVKVKRVLSIVHEYDLSREFPLASIRPVNLKGCIQEVLWIWQKRSVRIDELGLHIWDAWADSAGRIAGCYGDSVNTPVIVSWEYREGLAPIQFSKCVPYLIRDQLYDMPCQPGSKDRMIGYGFTNQTDFILWSLKNDQTSRRIIASMFMPQVNAMKPLEECAMMINLSVQDGKLNMTLYQRSCDVVTALLWNTAQYAALQMMFAHDAGLGLGKLTHFIQDAHVYDRHEKQAENLLSRSLFGTIPQVTISERMEGKGFYDFTPEDFEVWNYEPKEQIKFEVAI